MPNNHKSYQAGWGERRAARQRYLVCTACSNWAWESNARRWGTCSCGAQWPLGAAGPAKAGSAWDHGPPCTLGDHLAAAFQLAKSQGNDKVLANLERDFPEISSKKNQQDTGPRAIQSAAQKLDQATKEQWRIGQKLVEAKKSVQELDDQLRQQSERVCEAKLALDAASAELHKQEDTEGAAKTTDGVADEDPDMHDWPQQDIELYHKSKKEAQHHMEAAKMAAAKHKESLDLYMRDRKSCIDRATKKRKTDVDADTPQAQPAEVEMAPEPSAASAQGPAVPAGSQTAGQTAKQELTVEEIIAQATATAVKATAAKPTAAKLGKAGQSG